MRAVEHRLPVLLVGGFLGAGKTTLVNQLLRQANGNRIAVLVNDFGDVSIDAELIESTEQSVLHIAGGCMCCSYGDDLVAALRQLSAKRQSFDRVLIETSGVSLPYTIACTVPLIEGFELRATVVLVDGLSVCGQLEDPLISDTVLRQMDAADLILLNKMDRVATAEHGARIRLVQELSSGAPVWATTRSQVSWEAIEQNAGGARVRSARVSSNGSPSGLFDPTHTGDSMGMHRPASLFQSRTVEMRERIDFEALGKALRQFRAEVIRAKIIAQDLYGRWYTLSFSSGDVQTQPFAGTPAGPCGVFIFRAHIDAEKMLKDIVIGALPMPNKSLESR